MMQEVQNNKMVEWELTLKCNYNCDYCEYSRLRGEIKEVTDEKKLTEFIEELNSKYPDIEIFVFGGEPFLHPKVEYIINELQRVNQPFVVQSNLSNVSTKIIKNLKTKPFKMFVSIHPSQTDISSACKNIVETHPDEIHLMYTETSGKVERYYNIIDKIKGSSKLILTPVSNLACTGYEDVLKKYNQIRYNYNFDKNKVSLNGVEMYRSDIWEIQNSTEKSLTKGKPCIYKDKYFLYTPDLKLMNCCYIKVCKDVCTEQNCFFM